MFCTLHTFQCDQKKPSCGQCTLSRISCGGYDQPRIFVNSGLEHGATSDKLRRFENVAYSVAKSPFSQFGSEFASLEGSPTHTSARDNLPARFRTRSPQPPLLKRSLESTALESKYLEIYWTSLLPHGQAFPPQAGRYSTTRWTDAIQDLYHEDPLVRTALLANAVSLMAQTTENPSLMAQGWRLYGFSLQATARSLTGGKLQGWGRALALSGLLASYEVVTACTSPKMVWFDLSTDLRARFCANSCCSMLMDNIHGCQQPHG